MESVRTSKGQAESKTDAAISMPTFSPVVACALQVQEGRRGFRFSRKIMTSLQKGFPVGKKDLVIGSDFCAPHSIPLNLGVPGPITTLSVSKVHTRPRFNLGHSRAKLPHKTYINMSQGGTDSSKRSLSHEKDRYTPSLALSITNRTQCQLDPERQSPPSAHSTAQAVFASSYRAKQDQGLVDGWACSNSEAALCA